MEQTPLPASASLGTRQHAVVTSPCLKNHGGEVDEVEDVGRGWGSAGAEDGGDVVQGEQENAKYDVHKN